MIQNSSFICVGVISSPHGINGLCKVKYYTEIAKGLVSYGDIFNSKGEVIKLKLIKNLNKLAVCKIDNINNKNEIEKFKGLKLYILRENLPKLDKNEVYHADLVGLTALNSKRKKIGIIEKILNYGANDIFEISRDDKESLLIPSEKKDLKNIDLNNKTIIISDYEKWLELEEKVNA